LQDNQPNERNSSAYSMQLPKQSTGLTRKIITVLVIFFLLILAAGLFMWFLAALFGHGLSDSD
jgi:hypothetical protein